MLLQFVVNNNNKYDWRIIEEPNEKSQIKSNQIISKHSKSYYSTREYHHESSGEEPSQ